MAIVYTDWVGESTPTTGDGDITLGGALRGFAPMNASGGAGQIYYTIVDGEDRETGVGNYDGEVTFQRTTVFATLTGGVYTPSGARLNLSGSAQIYGTINSGVMESIFDALAQNDISFDELYLYIDDQISDVNQAITSLDNQVNTRIDNLTPADIGAANQSHTHTPAEVGMDDLIANKWITLAAPAGAVAGTYYPVIIYLDTGTAGGDVNIHTPTGSSTLPINYNSFVGKIGAGGFTDRGQHIDGELFRYTPSEIGIGCVAIPTESADAAVFYVAGNAFPVEVLYNSGNPIPKTATSIVHGTSTFNTTTDPYVPAGVKVGTLMKFDQGSGKYSNASIYSYGNFYARGGSGPIKMKPQTGREARLESYDSAGARTWYLGHSNPAGESVVLFNDFTAKYFSLLDSGEAFVNTKFIVDEGGAADVILLGGSNSGIMMRNGSDVNQWFAYYEPGSSSYRVARYNAGAYVEAPIIVESTGRVQLKDPVSQSSQGTLASSLTRKDYVDTQVATRAASSHSHTATDVNAATRNCNFAARLDNSRTMTGSTAPTLPGVWDVSNSTWTPYTYGSLFVTTNRADESTTPGSGTFIHYLFIGHDERVYVATNVNGSMSAWGAIYDSAHKPTPADIGAPYKMVEGTNFTNKSMTVVLLGKNGRNYPITAPLVAGTYWVSNRGGENADRDYDFGFTISGTSPSFSFAGVGGASIVKIYTM